jgi:hypothetical protein
MNLLHTKTMALQFYLIMSQCKYPMFPIFVLEKRKGGGGGGGGGEYSKFKAHGLRSTNKNSECLLSNQFGDAEVLQERNKIFLLEHECKQESRFLEMTHMPSIQPIW